MTTALITGERGTSGDLEIPDNCHTASDARSLDLLADAVLARVEQRLLIQRWPGATYRVQFNQDFTFKDATDLVSYWHKLGITDLYTSPYLKADVGSRHGYDIVDHSQLNPELGMEADFLAFVAALRAHDMGHIHDFVPNHMGISGNENGWFQDVLENGPSSRYAAYFDIDWHPLKTDLEFKVLLPVLGSQFGRALENQELRLEFRDGAFWLQYFNRRFPIAPRSYDLILRHRLDELGSNREVADAHLLEFHSILTAISHLPERHEVSVEKREERAREKEIIKRRIQRLCDESPDIRQFVCGNIERFNGQRGDPRSFDLLDQLLQQQAYRLSLWRVAADEINYRRFFDVNELAAICMERAEVFESTHRLIMQLLDDGKVDGLRIDHADGLFDPTAYLWQLQEQRYLQLCRQEFVAESGTAAGCLWSDLKLTLRQRFVHLRECEPRSLVLRPQYLVVEKILGQSESLPDDWPVDGSTGYEFLNLLNGLFVDSHKARELEAACAKFVGCKQDFRELIYDAKRLILKVSMSSELHVLGHQLDRISEGNRWTRDFTRQLLIQALREVIACFPVYRTYTVARQVRERDRQYIEAAIQDAKLRNPAVSGEVFDFIRSVLLHDAPEGTGAEEWTRRTEFVGRFQQFTGPMMAKAVEDTAFYRFHRLISLNEVGGDPERVGVSVEDFHESNVDRKRRHPRGMLTTSTHDTKRSEDVRARINVLSEIPSEWKNTALRWARLNRKLKTKLGGELVPSRNDEYLLYQTLVGAWPLVSPTTEELREFVRRIQVYMLKAVREAKLYSSWIAPNEGYEQALRKFIATILLTDSRNSFRRDLEAFVQRIIPFGLWNSLSQTLLKLTSPGIPDIYQGTELWDFSLVDPDNRRPVNYALRQQLLEGLRCTPDEACPDGNAFARRLLTTARDGRIKLFAIARTLHAVRNRAALFQQGDYLPLEVLGSRRDHICAFARIWKGQWSITVVPRLFVSLLEDGNEGPLGLRTWRDTRVVLPKELGPSRVRQVFTDAFVGGGTPNGDLLVADLLSDFPIALLLNEP